MSPALPLDPSQALGSRQHPEDTAQSHLAAGVSMPTRARPGPRQDLWKEITCVLGSFADPECFHARTCSGAAGAVDWSLGTTLGLGRSWERLIREEGQEEGKKKGNAVLG